MTAQSERAAVVSWLLEQSNKGAGIALGKPRGSTSRAAHGGGSYALKRAAEEIGRGEHVVNDNAPMRLQDRVDAWIRRCFSREIVEGHAERNQRFLEEALELVQALGMGRAAAHALVDYVYDRPVGDPPQEVSGVVITLAAACNARGIDIDEAVEAEMRRIEDPAVIERIREKQRGKPDYR